MNARVFLLMAATLLPILSAAAPGNERGAIRPSITIATGVGQYAIRDEFFSHERYSGTLPHFQAEWQRSSSDHGHRIGISAQTGDDIFNHSLATQITQLRFYGDYLRPPRPLEILSRDATLRVSPSTELCLLINRMQIAADGAELDVSVAAMLSLGANAEFSLPLRAGWQVEADVRSTILSFALRLIDMEEDEALPIALLTPLKGLHGTMYLGVRHRLGERFAGNAGYLINITRISEWHPVLGVGDLFTVGLSYAY